MSGEDLRVTTAHLCELAAKQRQAALEIKSATAVTDGVDEAIRSTHGSIASATVGILAAVLAVRRTAGEKMAATSEGLGDKLTEAAARYDLADDAMGATFGQQMQV